jgi:excisionase family DNA binding protein
MIAEIALPMQERFLTTEDIAEQLQVTEYTVRKWIRDGAIPAIRVGKNWRVAPADYQAFLQRLRDQQTKEE